MFHKVTNSQRADGGRQHLEERTDRIYGSQLAWNITLIFSDINLMFANDYKSIFK